MQGQIHDVWGAEEDEESRVIGTNQSSNEERAESKPWFLSTSLANYIVIIYLIFAFSSVENLNAHSSHLIFSGRLSAKQKGPYVSLP